MAVYRGAGGATDSTSEATISQVQTYAAQAATSATAAAASASSAASNATSASTAATNAASSASSASSSASTVAGYTSQAAGYAADASNEADDAAQSATEALGFAADASTFASNALASKNSASSYADAAAASASDAADSAAAAAASVSDAQDLYGDATALSNAVTAAAGSATSAASSASDASDSADAAAASAAAAQTNEDAAADWASDAQAAAVDALAFSSAAQSARDATLAAYDNFDDRYLGVKSADPTEDNDGNALVAGSLYFNESTGSMKVYTGTAWVDAYVSGSGFLVVNNNLSDLQSASTARTNLGLGTAATTAATDYATAAQGTKADTAIQAADLGSAAYTSATDYATAAQGTKADSAVQPNTSPTFTGATFSGGTANGVAYLNGSKVLTTGTNLTYGTGGGAYGLVAVAGGVSALDLKSGGGNVIQRFTNSSGTSWQEIAGTSAGWVFTNKNQTGNISFITTATGGATTQNLLMDSNGITQGATAFTANPTLGAGTVNGVAYLNGSKVLTSGSALTFDGSSLVGTGKFQSQVLRVKDASYSELYFSTADTGGNGAISYNHSANAMAFYANGSEGMRLTSTGLGIGTSSPGEKLQVTATTAQAGIKINNNNATTFVGAAYASGDYANGAVAGDMVLRSASRIALSANGGSSVQAVLDNSGNLGLGVTPSAWYSAYKAIELPNAGFLAFAGASGQITSNAYFDGAYKYKTTAAATQYAQSLGQHQWFTAPSGTAGNAISFTQAMTLNASGYLLVGATSSNGAGAHRLQVGQSGATAQILLKNSTGHGAFYSTGTDFYQSWTSGGFLAFGHAPADGSTFTERARIDSSGNLGLGVTPSAWNSGYKAQQIFNSSIFSAGDDLNFASNTYVDSSGTSRYISSYSYPTKYSMYNGVHQWFVSLSTQGAGNAISFTQAMTLDASGNVQIGTTSGAARLKLQAPAGNTLFHATDGTRGDFFIDFPSTEVTRLTAEYGVGGILAFANGTSKTERARIDASGNLLVGTTSQIGAGQVCINHDNSHWGMAIKNPGSSTQYTAIQFYYGSTACGLIQANNNNTTSYLTSSDYRLKENVRPLSGALNKIAAMRPVTYAWKATGTESDGFIAHELQAVCPDAVSGTKDAVDAEGKPVYQGIDTSFLVATLTAAIQEQQAIIEQLKARLDAANL